MSQWPNLHKKGFSYCFGQMFLQRLAFESKRFYVYNTEMKQRIDLWCCECCSIPDSVQNRGVTLTFCLNVWWNRIKFLLCLCLITILTDYNNKVWSISCTVWCKNCIKSTCCLVSGTSLCLPDFYTQQEKLKNTVHCPPPFTGFRDLSLTLSEEVPSGLVLVLLLF